jgi:hypothetical protein
LSEIVCNIAFCHCADIVLICSNYDILVKEMKNNIDDKINVNRITQVSRGGYEGLIPVMGLTLKFVVTGEL